MMRRIGFVLGFLVAAFIGLEIIGSDNASANGLGQIPFLVVEQRTMLRQGVFDFLQSSWQPDVAPIFETLSPFVAEVVQIPETDIDSEPTIALTIGANWKVIEREANTHLLRELDAWTDLQVLRTGAATSAAVADFDVHEKAYELGWSLARIHQYDRCSNIERLAVGGRFDICGDTMNRDIGSGLQFSYLRLQSGVVLDQLHLLFAGQPQIVSGSPQSGGESGDNNRGKSGDKPVVLVNGSPDLDQVVRGKVIGSALFLAALCLLAYYFLKPGGPGGT